MRSPDLLLPIQDARKLRERIQQLLREDAQGSPTYPDLDVAEKAVDATVTRLERVLLTLQVAEADVRIAEEQKRRNSLAAELGTRGRP